MHELTTSNSETKDFKVIKNFPSTAAKIVVTKVDSKLICFNLEIKWWKPSLIQEIHNLSLYAGERGVY